MRTSRRSSTTLAALALIGLAALPAAAGGCGYSAFGCGLDHDRTTAEPVRARTVAAVVPLLPTDTAAAAYRDLLPEGFELPGMPLVAVQLTTYDAGVCARPAQAPAVDCPSLPGWTEGVVALRTVVDGAEGWFPVSRPVTSAEQYDASRAAGLPAYLATGGVTVQGQGLSGEVSVEGTPALQLAWQPQAGGVFDASLLRLLQGNASLYGVTPLLSGSDRHRTTKAVRPTAPAFDLLGGAPNSALAVPGLTSTSGPQRGSVTLRLDADLERLDDASPDPLPAPPLAVGTTLADLVALEQTVTGLRWQVDGLLLTQTDALDDGQDGPLPAPPALASAIVAGPGAQTSGYATRVSTMTRGSTLTFANLDATQHDVLSLESRPDGTPLFHSPVVSQGGTAEVAGADLLLPGQYRWVCSLHAGMTGELVVQ